MGGDTLATAAKFGFIEDFSGSGSGLIGRDGYGSFTISSGIAGANGSYALEKEEPGVEAKGPYTNFGSYSTEFVD